MSEDKKNDQYIYVINDTKKEFFVIPLNSTCDENDSEEIKNMTHEERLFLHAIKTTFYTIKENNWDNNTDDIRRVIADNLNMNKYQSNGYILK